MGRGAEVVGRYFDALVVGDWDAFAATLAEDVVRVGPFGDVYTPRAPYVAFLAELLPTLPGYRLELRRVLDTGDTVVVQLAETVDGVVTPETIVFDLDGAGSIARVDICIRRSA